MSQRAVDCEVAKRVSVAEELARLGATPVLIERLTGFGPRWSRGLVRRHGGPTYQKPRDPKYFDMDAARRHEGWLYLSMYLDQPSNLSLGARMVEAYIAYQGTQQPGILGINECAQVVELSEAGNATIRQCKQCGGGHLVFFEGRVCPECFLLARTFCKCCQGPLKEGARHTTLYCENCRKAPERISHLRRARRVRRTTEGQIPAVRVVGSLGSHDLVAGSYADRRARRHSQILDVGLQTAPQSYPRK